MEPNQQACVTNICGVTNVTSSPKDPNDLSELLGSDYFSSTAYADACLASISKNLVRLHPKMRRPAGTHFMGAKNWVFPAHINSEDGHQMDVILDSGSDITLISEAEYKKLTDKPRRKEGRTIEIQQVAGTLEIKQYITFSLFIKTDQGPVALEEIEAYLVPGMKRPFILGNDFADQYELNPSRTEEGTILTLGSSGRTIPLHNSTYSTETWVLTADTLPSPPILPANSRDVVVAQPTTIPPHKAKLVPIAVNWPKGQEEWYVESIDVYDIGGDNSYVMEALINKESTHLVVINSGSSPLELPKGQKLGYARNPDTFLQKKLETKEAKAQAFAIQTLVQTFTKPAPSYEPKEEEGGPKTAQFIDNPANQEELLKEIQINPALPTKYKEALKALVLKKIQAFGIGERLGKSDIEVELNLKEGAEPFSGQLYHASPAKMEVIDKQLDKWLKQEVIKVSKSNWGAPVLVVYRTTYDPDTKEPITKPRVCIDYRKINQMMIKDEYPIPNQATIFQTLRGKKWISTLDALSGFHQMKIKEEDQHKSAFRTHRGLFEFIRLPFGFHNGPPSFQRAMNNIFAEMLWLFIIVYIDDIICFSDTFEEHLGHLEQVLDALIKANITLSPKKCFLGYQSILVLGQKVSRLGMSTHKEKVDAIDRLEPPKTIKQLQTVLGMFVYFSAFIPYYAIIMSPLFKLLHKDKKWEWGEQQQHAFELAKQVLKSAPILGYGMPEYSYRLYTDASGEGIAAVLQQVQPIKIKDLEGTRTYDKLKKAYDTGQPVPELVKPVPEGIEPPREPVHWAENFEDTIVFIERVIAYYSRILNSAERNYSPTELEALAVKAAILKFQAYIDGRTVVIITDHSALTWSKTYQGVNRRLLTWGTVFNAIPNLHIVHRAGRVHSNVDPLSRIRTRIPMFEAPAKDPEVPIELNTKEDDGEAWKNQFYERKKAEAMAADIVVPREEFLQKYREGYQADSFFKNILDQLKEVSDWRRPDISLFFTKENGLLYRLGPNGEERLCVPNSQVKEVLQEHDKQQEGFHFGWDKTYNTLHATRYWPHMARDVRKYVESCDLCQKNKSMNRSLGLLEPNLIPSFPFQ